MAFDPVYKDFILPYYQAEKKRVDKELRLRQKEAQRADAAEERNKHLEAELARLKKR
jgi:hypothetical protein